MYIQHVNTPDGVVVCQEASSTLHSKCSGTAKLANSTCWLVQLIIQVDQVNNGLTADVQPCTYMTESHSALSAAVLADMLEQLTSHDVCFTFGCFGLGALGK